MATKAFLSGFMKKIILIAFLFISFHSYSQSVFGYWYGLAKMKTNNSAHNYLVELVLQPEKNFVKGVLNYYFKNNYRSVLVKGNYNAATRQVNLYDVPIIYYGSHSSLEVDCLMNMLGTLRVSRTASEITGSFIGLPEYKYTCPAINFTLTMDMNMSNKDSVLKAISDFKETNQVWKPEKFDTLVAVTATPKKVINYVTEKEFTNRENEVVNEIEVESDSLKLSFYDNGDIDGDVISIFYNKQLILNSQKLTHKSIKINLVLDSLQKTNEISMFAETMGTIPPNTALMVIDDGKNKFEIRLSSNMNKNATIRFKRKKLN
jgi:hypothetical protein